MDASIIEQKNKKRVENDRLVVSTRFFLFQFLLFLPDGHHQTVRQDLDA